MSEMRESVALTSTKSFAHKTTCVRTHSRLPSHGMAYSASLNQTEVGYIKSGSTRRAVGETLSLSSSMHNTSYYMRCILSSH